MIPVMVVIPEVTICVVPVLVRPKPFMRRTVQQRCGDRKRGFPGRPAERSAGPRIPPPGAALLLRVPLVVFDLGEILPQGIRNRVPGE